MHITNQHSGPAAGSSASLKSAEALVQYQGEKQRPVRNWGTGGHSAPAPLAHNSSACDLEDGSFLDGALYNGLSYRFGLEEELWCLEGVHVFVNGRNVLEVAGCVQVGDVVYDEVKDYGEPIIWGPTDQPHASWAASRRYARMHAQMGGVCLTRPQRMRPSNFLC